MIEIKKYQKESVELNSSHSEWEKIKLLLLHASKCYSNTELSTSGYSIEEIQDIAHRFTTINAPPIQISLKDICGFINMIHECVQLRLMPENIDREEICQISNAFAEFVFSEDSKVVEYLDELKNSL